MELHYGCHHRSRRAVPVPPRHAPLHDLDLSLADEPLRCRRRLLTVNRSLARRSSTVLLPDESEPDLAPEKLVHNIFQLGRMAPEYGDVRRRLSIAKMLGMDFNRDHRDARS